MTRRVVQAILASSAAAGLIGAHVIAYLIALPDAALRSALLRTTGHGYLSAAIVVATVAGIFGVVAAAAVGFRSGVREQRFLFVGGTPPCASRWYRRSPSSSSRGPSGRPPTSRRLH